MHSGSSQYCGNELKRISSRSTSPTQQVWSLKVWNRLFFLPRFLYIHAVFIGAHRGQKKALDPLKLQLETVVSYHIENEPGSSIRIASALTTKPYLQPHFKNYVYQYSPCMLVLHIHAVPMQSTGSLGAGGNTIVVVNGHVGAQNLRSSGKSAIAFNCWAISKLLWMVLLTSNE